MGLGPELSFSSVVLRFFGFAGGRGAILHVDVVTEIGAIF